MTNYKKMYFDLAVQVDKVVNLLIEAQNNAEDEYCKDDNSDGKNLNDEKNPTF